MTPNSHIYSQRVANFSETVFAKYTALALKHKAINLGQGFPDFHPPELIVEALQKTLHGYHQYAPLAGMPQLNKAVAKAKSRLLGRELDPTQNVQITVGATEALFAACQAFINPGDEVVLLEPFYDAYPADVLMAGGIPRYVALELQKDGSWHLNLAELRRAFSKKTKAIFLNTPHNPTGKVFSAEELDQIIALAREFDAIIISDEAYEYIAFEPHISPSSRPDGWERTLAISSAGKTFSVTGWKIGWAVGPARLIQALRMAHQWIPFSVATPLQLATAMALEAALEEKNSYFNDLTTLYKNKRDLLLGALKDTAFIPLSPQGSYFIMADASGLGYLDDVALCEDLPKRIGIAAIPPSAFYSEAHKHQAKQLVRFAFCKSDAVLLEAKERFSRL